MDSKSLKIFNSCDEIDDFFFALAYKKSVKNATFHIHGEKFPLDQPVVPIEKKFEQLIREEKTLKWAIKSLSKQILSNKFFQLLLVFQKNWRRANNISQKILKGPEN